LVSLELKEDERGFFARAWCERETGLDVRWVQANISFSRAAGTLRGMHFQSAPHEEVKLVRCTRGSVFDAIIDVRPGSATRGQWFGTVLSRENRLAVLVPAGFAHGFLTFEDDSEVFYLVSQFYEPSAECGLRWDDPSIGIAWPAPVRVVSPKDSGWPDWQAGIGR
jgi:dTDP-4-dehydrorhamnose 3,5-epimerase